MESREYELMDAAEDRMWWYRALHVRLIDELAAVRGRVLDAGCGTGGFLAQVRRARPLLGLVGVEYQSAAAIRAAEKAQALVAGGDVNALPFADASFDAVISADVLCHAGVSPAKALAEFFRVLRPGGRLVLNMPAYEWLTSAHDRRVANARRVTPSLLTAWLREAQFVSIRSRFWNSLLLPLMIIQRKLLARGDAASDVAAFPPWLDAMLYAVTAIEHRLNLSLPFGGSVLATATKPLLDLP
jgi:ubiquinone/menaquinone biosynthesis C-methylase UbiE